MTICRSCDAPVIFVASATSGRPMILDAKPEKRVVVGHDFSSSGSHPFGFVFEGAPACEEPTARVVDTYVDHHATCPKAGEWKERRR